MAGVDIDRDSYPSNSMTKASEKQPEKPKAEKIITGTVVTRKTPLGKKLKNIFLGDNFLDIKDYVLKDVLLPTMQNAVLDIVNDTLSMRFFGTAGRRRSSRSYYSYDRYYDDRRDNRRRRTDDRRDVSARRSYDEIILSNGLEADEVLSRMCDIIENYGCVSVSDLYGMVGKRASVTDYDWGWFELGSARVKRVSDGYLIDLPRVVSLK